MVSMKTKRTPLKDELIGLAEALCEQRNWSERYLSELFGQSNAMRVLRDGKHGLGLNTAERFRSWLLDQLNDTAPRSCGDGVRARGRR